MKKLGANHWGLSSLRFPHLDFEGFIEAANEQVNFCMGNVVEGQHHNCPASCLS